MPDRDSYAEGTPSWVDLMTTDVEGAESFYSALFGWEWTRNDTDQPGLQYHMATLRGRDVCGLSQQPQEQVDMGIPPVWNQYITVDDVDATAGRVEESGGSVMAPPFDVMDAGRMTVVVDPSGAVVSLWQPKENIGAGVINEPGAFTWAELQTNDQDAAADFFGKLVGWGSEKTEMPGLGAMTFFKVGEDDVASAMPIPVEGVPAHWQVYFAVEDCDASCQKIKDLGGHVLMDPMDAPPGRMAAVTDPAGAVFSIIALANPPE